jgi:hypothetical protein
VNLLLQKTEGPVSPRKQRLKKRKVHYQDVRTGIFEDLESYTGFCNYIERAVKDLSFFFIGAIQIKLQLFANEPSLVQFLVK